MATNEDWHSGVLGAAASGALSGGLAATGFGAGIQIVGNIAISAGESYITQSQKGSVDLMEVAVSGVIGGLAGAIGGKGFGSKHLNSLGRQATKRVTKTITNKGLSAAKTVVKKAFKYYIKNSATLIKNGIVKGILRPALASLTMRSSYNVYKYIRARR